MFYKIGFFVVLILLLLTVGMFVKMNPMKTNGAMSWAEMYSNNPKATLGFLDKSFGIKVTEVSKMPDGQDYNVIKASGQPWPFAGVTGLIKMPNGKAIEPSSMIYLTVKDYDTSHKKMIENGAVAHMDSMIAGGMKFGVYTIPGGVVIGVAQYEHVKNK